MSESRHYLANDTLARLVDELYDVRNASVI